MNYQDFARVGVLACALVAAGAATAQTSPATMTDTAPVPAHDRSSTGAIIIMDQPVLAQREAMQTAMERSAVDTRALGAGPARVQRKAVTKDEIEFEKALREAMEKQGPVAR